MDQDRTGNTLNEHVAAIIESRSPAGRHDSVRGWHRLLKNFLPGFVALRLTSAVGENEPGY